MAGRGLTRRRGRELIGDLRHLSEKGARDNASAGSGSAAPETEDAAGRIMALLDIEDVCRILRCSIKAAGNQTAWAKQFGLERSNVSQTLNGKRPPSKRLLKILGLQRVTAYRMIKRRVSEN